MHMPEFDTGTTKRVAGILPEHSTDESATNGRGAQAVDGDTGGSPAAALRMFRKPGAADALARQAHAVRR
jgi:hypothetical protein